MSVLHYVINASDEDTEIEEKLYFHENLEVGDIINAEALGVMLYVVTEAFNWGVKEDNGICRPYRMVQVKEQPVSL